MRFDFSIRKTTGDAKMYLGKMLVFEGKIIKGLPSCGTIYNASGIIFNGEITDKAINNSSNSLVIKNFIERSKENAFKIEFI